MAALPEADVPRTVLANGVRVPMVGFGTAFFSDDGVRLPEQVWSTLPAALEAGCRHIDTARMYGCERHVGTVLGRYFMEGRLTRGDLFVTTKVGHPPTKDYLAAKTQYIYDTSISAYDGVLREFYECLDDLGLGYVDLLLVHWPGLFDSPSRFPTGWKVPLLSKPAARKKRAEMWAALENIYERKLARAIGVSNFTREHLEHLLPLCKVLPMINQLEIHPYLVQCEFVTFCQTQGIHVTAFAPLASGKANVLADPKIKELADSKGVSPSQLVLSWLVQRDIIVIPKSSNRGRIAQNLRVSTALLDGEEMKIMDSLDRGLRTVTDPTDIP
mmetsp:Transcript_100990/g.283093  ORF Transcript_100990/g.283093 Transcript_100990/m.283093 type:complete len:329 (-) Transcript_100990:312-1298(-)